MDAELVRLQRELFALGALILILHGLSWLAWWAIPFPGDTQYFWGFFTIALGWMLRSWFLFPLPSRFCVRMCHGAPDTVAAPLGVFAVVTQ